MRLTFDELRLEAVSKHECGGRYCDFACISKLLVWLEPDELMGSAALSLLLLSFGPSLSAGQIDWMEFDAFTMAGIIRRLGGDHNVTFVTYHNTTLVAHPWAHHVFVPGSGWTDVLVQGSVGWWCMLGALLVSACLGLFMEVRVVDRLEGESGDESLNEVQDLQTSEIVRFGITSEMVAQTDDTQEWAKRAGSTATAATQTSPSDTSTHTSNTPGNTQHTCPPSAWSGSKECAVCLSAYQHGEELRVLPCQHRFHKECVDEWIETQAACRAERQLLFRHRRSPQHTHV